MMDEQALMKLGPTLREPGRGRIEPRRGLGDCSRARRRRTKLRHLGRGGEPRGESSTRSRDREARKGG